MNDRKRGRIVGRLTILAIFIMVAVVLFLRDRPEPESPRSATARIDAPESLLSADQPTPGSQKSSDTWRVMSDDGTTKMVYVPGDQIGDKFLLAQILHSIAGRSGSGSPIQVMFFDDEKFTPRGFPMTDQQMMHWRAQYTRNPRTGHEAFVFIEIADRTTSPPRMREIKADIRPGYAG